MKAYQDKGWWFSKISDYRKCPRFFQRKHLLKEKIEEAPDADLEFGSAMHLGLNEYLRGGDGLGIFKMSWEITGASEPVYGRMNHGELLECGIKLLTKFERLHLKKFKPFKMEERAFAEIEGTAFEGTPDFVGEFEGVPSVVDFKTAAYRYDKRKIVCDDQIPGYAVLAELAWGYKAEQGVYFPLIKDRQDPFIQKPLIHKLTEGYKSSILSNITETCREADARERFPMNQRSCIIGTKVCPYFESCHGKVKSEND